MVITTRRIFFLSHKMKLIRSSSDRFDLPSLTEQSTKMRKFSKNLFLRRYISKRDWAVYERLYQSMKRALRPPDVLIALTCSLSTTKKRIAKRGRESESTIPDSYLRRLHGMYDAWFDSYDLSPIVRIDTTSLDYVENLVDLIELTKRVNEALGIKAQSRSACRQ